MSLIKTSAKTSSTRSITELEIHAHIEELQELMEANMWLDLERLAQVEITSESAEHP